MALSIINGPVIQAGQSLSDAVDLTGQDLVRITMPAEWDNANLTFQLSSDGLGYNDLFMQDGAEVTMVVVTGAAVVLRADSGIKNAAMFVKFRSGSREFPVVQSAQRDFALAVQPAT